MFIAQGFVVNFKEFKIEKTGAIFLKFTPRDAVLSINDEETDLTQKGIIDLSGVMIKNLAPGPYRLKISKKDYYDWEKNLEVQSGLITSESQIRLWPKKFPDEILIEKEVKNFWLTKEGVIYENKDNQIFFNDSVIRGKVFLSDAYSKFLITRDANNYFLIDLENPRSAVNLTHLFNSLKQRQLALPGVVPLTNIFFHPFSPNKIVAVSETSLYTIDVKKIQIEKIITIEKIKLIKLGTNDAFILDNDGKLVIINLLLKTSLSEPVKLGSVESFNVGSNDTNLLILTPKKELRVYERSSGKTKTLTNDVKLFEVSPEEKRIAVLTTDNKLKIVYLKKLEGDLKYEAGTVVEIPAAPHQNAEKLSWFADFPNYTVFLDNNKLIIQEIDEREPVNSYHFSEEKILDYKIKGKKIYFLKENGELTVCAIAGDA